MQTYCRCRFGRNFDTRALPAPLLAACAVLLSLLAPCAAWAQSKTWNGSENTNWHTAGNWTPAGVPGSGDTVLIPPGTGNIEVNSTIAVSTLTLQRTITISSSVTGTVINIAQGGSLISGGNCGSALLENVTINGDIPSYSGRTLRWKNVTLNGSITLLSGSALHLDSNQTLNGTFIGAGTSSQPAVIQRWGNNAFITFGPNAVVRGEGLEIRSSLYCGTITGGYYVNQGLIHGENPANPIALSSDLFYNTSGALAGTVRVSGIVDLFGTSLNHASGTLQIGPNGNLRNGTLNLLGGTLDFISNFGCAGGTLENLTINGDLPAYCSGAMRWSNVVHNGTLTMCSGSAMTLVGNATLTGTIIGNGGDTGQARIVANSPLSRTTIAPGATVRGSGILFSTFCAVGGENSGSTLVNRGAIIGDNPANPLTSNIPLVTGEGTIAGHVNLVGGARLENGALNIDGATVRIGGVVCGGVINLRSGSLITTSGNPFVSNTIRGVTVNKLGGTFDSTTTETLLDDVVINGNIDNYTGDGWLWGRVQLNGTISMLPGSRIRLNGSGPLTGTVQGLAFANTPARIEVDCAKTLTIAPGATVTGQGLLLSERPFCNSGASRLINLGTVSGTSAAHPIVVDATLPGTNYATVSGAVTTPPLATGVDWTIATPAQAALVSTSRADPGASSTQTFTFANLYLPPGVQFTLGTGETLSLGTAGNGTLYIAPGATFRANGVVNAKIVNLGHLVLPPERAGSLFGQITGGIVQVTPPAQSTSVNYPTSAPWLWPRATFTALGGFGFGDRVVGGGGGGTPPAPRTHTVSTALTLQGTAAWDGRLNVTGSFTATDSAVVRLYIAGSTPGTTYSRLSATQGASLRGTLQIILEPELFGYTPPVGATFDVLTAAGGISLPGGPNGLCVQTFLTAQRAAQLGLNLPAHSSGFDGDPNALVQLPTNLFDVALVNNNTTLRLSVARPVDCPQPAITGDVRTCPGATASFTVSPAGAGPFGYQWRYLSAPGATPINVVNGPRITGAQGAQLAISALTPADAGYYDCVITPPAGAGTCPSIRSSQARLTIGCGNPSNIAGPGQVATCDDTLTADDIIVFIGWFFTGNIRADVAGQGQVPTPDGQFTADDIILFINRFFAGC
jgi:hypothetical protein